MRISLWSYYLEGLSPEDMASTFSQHGWMQTELSSEHGHALLDSDAPSKSIEAFKSYADSLGFSCPQAHFDLSADIAQPPGSAEMTAELDNMKRWCDMFMALDVKAGVLHPGGKRLRKEGWAREDILSCSAEALNSLAEHVAGGPTTLCLENASFSKDTMQLVDAIASPTLCVCMDTGHLHLEGAHWSEFISWAGKRLKALHIADNLGERDDHMLPYGKGRIDWNGFGAALKEAGYEGLFNFEIGGESSGRPLEVRLMKMEYIRKLALFMLGEQQEQP